MTAVENDGVLRRLGDEIRAAYGERLASVVLFGSRARGDAQVDSDYDVAVFLISLVDPVAEDDRLADIGWGMLRDLGAVVSVKAFRAEDRDGATLLMENIREEGVLL
jgi:predicted nucleotidyltransferase